MAQANGLPARSKETQSAFDHNLWCGRDGERCHCKGCGFIVGIGGSATNDAALGMLQALGYRFLDKSGNELGLGGAILGGVYHVDESHVLPELKTCEFTASRAMWITSCMVLVVQRPYLCGARCGRRMIEQR